MATTAGGFRIRIWHPALSRDGRPTRVPVVPWLGNFMALICCCLGLAGRDAVTFLSRYCGIDSPADKALSAPRPDLNFCGKSLFLLITSMADGCFWVHLTMGSRRPLWCGRVVTCSAQDLVVSSLVGNSRCDLRRNLIWKQLAQTSSQRMGSPFGDPPTMVRPP